MTTITPGDLAVTKYRGEWRLQRVLPDDGLALYVDRLITAGQRIHRCVVVGNRLESRACYVAQDGDFTWVDSGKRGLGTMNPVIGWSMDGPPIFVNRAVNAKLPQWLREAQ